MPFPTFFNLSEERRRCITEVAITEFANHSYEAASISRIVTQSKIAKGSFYQYFADKQDLYLYLVDYALEFRNAFIAESNLPSIQVGFFVYLRALFQANLDFELTHPALAQILFRTPHHGDLPFREEVFKRTKAVAMEFIKMQVEQGIARGQLVADLDPDIAAFTIVTLGTEIRRFIPTYLGLNVNPLIKDGPELNSEVIGRILDGFIRTLKDGMGTDCDSSRS